MPRRVADQLAQTLAAAGVDRVWGIVGDSLNGFTEALRTTRIRWMHVRHEEVAAFAAGAEAQITGKLAVCAGSCGPGNLHDNPFDVGMTGLIGFSSGYHAMLDCDLVPMTIDGVNRLTANSSRPMETFRLKHLGLGSR